MNEIELFPDGTPIDKWFYDTDIPSLEELEKQYVINDYNILDDGEIHTKEFQALIETVAENGGGVIVVPQGVYRTGALFFKQGVNLFIKEGGTVLGSDDIQRGYINLRSAKRS
jgi:polygalacturonase